jgi:carbonic anhydrase/acetyltransferase-like protein (isoleucine patch superfamily)
MRFLGSLIIAFFPSPIKIWIFRRMGWHIGHKCYIGFSIVHANQVTLGNNVYIGHLNVIWRLQTLAMGSGSRINFKNWITGAHKGTFRLGKNSAVSGRHFLEASAEIIVGDNSIIAGRESQFFSHGISPGCLDDKRPIQIGDWCYIGSVSRFVPGAKVPSYCFVGMGSVVTKAHEEECMLLAGVPAKPRKKLNKKDAFFNRPFFPHAHHLSGYDGNSVKGISKKNDSTN